ncbi:unnamed protein product [Sphagnum tenellum]
MTRGLTTATKTAVLNTMGNSTPDMLWKVNYYDDLGRPTNEFQQHYLGGLGLTQSQESYAFTYDGINRLTLSSYTTPGALGKFNEALHRGAGNQLYGVADAGTATQSGTYTYDPNGNVLTDTRNQITNIQYNLLNLPQNVTRTPGNMTYLYDANGTKLEKVSGGIIRDYIEGIEYNNGTIEFIGTEEGRAIPIGGGSYSYEYYLKDHLGNTRAAVKDDGSIVQVQDYYAFGLEMNPGNSLSPSPPNQYLYNKKELQEELGQYDYGARFYDPCYWKVDSSR